MKIAIMQPYVLPYIGYFQLVNSVDQFVFLDDVNFINKGWINRNNIQNKGTVMLFTIPLQNASQNEIIKNIYVLNDGKWLKKFFTSLEHSYKKSPFYEERIELLKQIFDFEEITISDLAKRSILNIAKELNFKTKFIDSSSIFENQELKGEARIIDIVLKSNATHYINPIGGQELYNKDQFIKNKVNLNFIKTNPIQYNQFNKSFSPNLSIVDVLMYNNNNQVVELLNEFTLI